MKTFKFVYFEGDTELPVPLLDVMDAGVKLDSAGGEIVLRMSDGRPSKIEGERVMAMIRTLGDMPQYRGKRIDAIELDTPH